MKSTYRLLIISFVLSILLLIPTRELMAEPIQNVSATQVGKSIVISYDLAEKYDISVFYTDDEWDTQYRMDSYYADGDLGRGIKPGKRKKIVWRVSEQYPGDAGRRQWDFSVEGRPSLRWFGLFHGTYSLDSGFMTGLTIGQIAQWGWYAKLMATTAYPRKTAYVCDEYGAVDGIMPAYSGIVSSFKCYGIAGATIRLGAPVYALVGVGYGARICDWQMIDGRWNRNASKSYQGVAVDLGIMTKFGNFCASFGATYLYKTFDFNIGLGYVF